MALMTMKYVSEADNQTRSIRLTQYLRYLLGLLDVLILQETAATGINAKSIMWKKTVIAYIPHRRIM